MSAKKPGRFALPRIAGAPEPAAEARRPGPMAVAGRDSAEALTRLAEEQAEQRRRNADDADAFRAAQAEGRVLKRLPIGSIRTDSLPRDRLALEAVAQSEEMEELKASIRARGQREAIEVCASDDEAVHHLLTGWRRLEALRQLHRETGEARFATVLARVTRGDAGRDGHYVAMVEENAIREDVSFAEMANVAIQMARDPLTAVDGVEDAVNRLYGSLHKVKRSNIRRFVDLLLAVGDALPAPRETPKNLGADVARALQSGAGDVEALRRSLRGARDAAGQNAALAAFLERCAAARGAGAAPSLGRAGQGGRAGVAFRAAGLTVTARGGALTLRGDADFTTIPRERLEAAVAAFRAALDG